MVNEAEIGQYPVDVQEFISRAKRSSSCPAPSFDWGSVVRFLIWISIEDGHVTDLDKKSIESGFKGYFSQIIKIIPYIPTDYLYKSQYPYNALGFFVRQLLNEFALSAPEALQAHFDSIKNIFSMILSKIDEEVDLTEAIFSDTGELCCDVGAPFEQGVIWVVENCFDLSLHARLKLDNFKLAKKGAELNLTEFIKHMILKSQFELDQVLQLREIYWADDSEEFNQFVFSYISDRCKRAEAELKGRKRLMSSSDDKQQKVARSEQPTESFRLRVSEYYGKGNVGWEMALLFALNFKMDEYNPDLFYYQDKDWVKGGVEGYFKQIDKILDYLPKISAIQNVHPLGVFVENLLNELNEKTYAEHQVIIKQIFSKMFSKIPSYVDVAEVIFSRSECWDFEEYLDLELLWIFDHCLNHLGKANSFKIATKAASSKMEDVVVGIIKKSDFETGEVLQLKETLYTAVGCVYPEIDDFFADYTGDDESKGTLVLKR